MLATLLWSWLEALPWLKLSWSAAQTWARILYIKSNINLTNIYNHNILDTSGMSRIGPLKLEHTEKSIRNLHVQSTSLSLIVLLWWYTKDLLLIIQLLTKACLILQREGLNGCIKDTLTKLPTPSWSEQRVVFGHRHSSSCEYCSSAAVRPWKIAGWELVMAQGCTYGRPQLLARLLCFTQNYIFCVFWAKSRLYASNTVSVAALCRLFCLGKWSSSSFRLSHSL